MTKQKVLAQTPSTLIQTLTDVIKTHSKMGAFFLLAFSGGVDSMVLLHALVALKKTIPFKLQAVHVHHGLSAHADEWAQSCVAACANFDVPLHVAYVNIDQQAGIGIEAEARKLRYQTLMQYHDNETYPDYILTAHHQDDQAETFLLQLFRGAGVKGLACMPLLDESRKLLRPLLEVSQKEIQTYANVNQLSWIEDDSNNNIYFERNFLRHEVLPILENRMPAVKIVLSRTATHLAEAQALLETLAQMDAHSLIKENSLCVEGLMQLTMPRAKNLLRWWLANNQISMPNATHLNQMLEQLFYAKTDAKVSVELEGCSVKRYQQRVYLVVENAPVEFDLIWQGEDALQLPNGDKLFFNKVIGQGLSVKHGIEKLRITNRKGGESFKPDVNRPTRTLKHLLQEANIPPWIREQLPLIYWQDTLVFVPQIGPIHDLKAGNQEAGIEIVWQMQQA